MRACFDSKRGSRLKSNGFNPMKLVERIHMVHRLLRYRWIAERAEMNFVLGRRYNGGTLLDIGAHRGVYSYWMHRRFRDTKVVAFEPQPELVEHLARLKQAFGLERMLIAPVGLSSHGGTLRMHRPRAHWGAATFDEFSFDEEQSEVFDVRVTSIDDYLAEHPELRPV
jgi:FkbM family methyltransferase